MKLQELVDGEYYNIFYEDKKAQMQFQKSDFVVQTQGGKVILYATHVSTYFFRFNDTKIINFKYMYKQELYEKMSPEEIEEFKAAML